MKTPLKNLPEPSTWLVRVLVGACMICLIGFIVWLLLLASSASHEARNTAAKLAATRHSVHETDKHITNLERALTAQRRQFVACKGVPLKGNPVCQAPVAPPTSAIGPPGQTGKTGPPGLIGPRGPTGPDGPAGHTGTTGPAGAVGAAGVAGPPGHEGPQGPPGPAGADGKNGTDGKDGAPGPPGPQGPPGPVCPDGYTGQLEHLMRADGSTADVFACVANTAGP